MVFPVRSDNYTDRQIVLLAGIDYSAAEHPRPDERRPYRIAHRVDNPAWSEPAVLFGRDFYHLLDAYRIKLVRPPLQTGFLYELLCNQAVTAFRQHDKVCAY